MAVLRVGVSALLALVAALGLWVARPDARAGLPSRLSDAEFWGLVTELSEPGGFFRSDNLVSNEDTFQQVLPDLVTAVEPGGAYLGVGPDQNFTYIAALNPGVAFITDIRRGNLHLHLMYKALFELSRDRVDFLSRLFSRRRPARLARAATPDQIFTGFATEPPRRELFDANFRAILDVLRRRHQFPLEAGDVEGIEYVLDAFYWGGPILSYSNTPTGLGQYPTFRDLQVSADRHGRRRGYLASDEAFLRVRSLQQRNLIVPLVGDFAGPKTLRATGNFIRARGGTVTAFYTSNVEQYLFQDGTWPQFAANVASLPLDESSTFIRSCFNTNCASSPSSRSLVLLDPISALLKDVDAGLISSYADVLAYRR